MRVTFEPAVATLQESHARITLRLPLVSAVTFHDSRFTYLSTEVLKWQSKH